MGNAKTYFNQYIPFNPTLFSSVPAPVIMFFSSQLSTAGFTGIPSNVSSIVYDDKGNSIWFHQTSNSFSQFIEACQMNLVRHEHSLNIPSLWD